jgi:nucleoside phosphorylase
MNLFTFAHRKEAEAFIDYLSFKPIAFYFDGLYKNQDSYLLITGEGLHNASEKTIAVLSSFADQIDNLVNIGVAGSLSAKLKMSEIISVRTSYAHHAERLEFKSFTSKSSDTTVDCMSVYDRVINISDRKKLSAFASLIDRELWSIASAAHLFKKSFQSIKYISDDLESENFCQLVINNSEFISKKLLDFYMANNSNDTTLNPNEEDSYLTLKSTELYFTVTQKRSLLHLLSLLKNTNFNEEEFLRSKDVKEIFGMEISAKEKTKKVLELLVIRINPIHSTITNKLTKIISPLKKDNIEVKYDRNFEDPTIEVSFKIDSQEKLDKIKESLSLFDFKQIQEVYDGKLDV